MSVEVHGHFDYIKVTSKNTHIITSLDQRNKGSAHIFTNVLELLLQTIGLCARCIRF